MIRRTGARSSCRFDNNRHKAGDKQILYEYENLPLERSVTWTYHAVSDVPVRSDDVGAHSARYTAVLLSGGRVF